MGGEGYILTRSQPQRVPEEISTRAMIRRSCKSPMVRTSRALSLSSSILPVIYNRFLIFIFCWSICFSTGYCGTLKPSCRLVGHDELIDVAGCDLVVVKVNKCKGYCTSFSFFHPINNDKLTVHAKCCRMTEVKHVEVAVSCNDGEKTVKIPSAVECNCYDCSADTLK